MEYTNNEYERDRKLLEEDLDTGIYTNICLRMWFPRRANCGSLYLDVWYLLLSIILQVGAWVVFLRFATSSTPESVDFGVLVARVSVVSVVAMALDALDFSSVLHQHEWFSSMFRKPHWWQEWELPILRFNPSAKREAANVPHTPPPGFQLLLFLVYCAQFTLACATMLLSTWAMLCSTDDVVTTLAGGCFAAIPDRAAHFVGFMTKRGYDCEWRHCQVEQLQGQPDEAFTAKKDGFWQRFSPDGTGLFLWLVPHLLHVACLLWVFCAHPHAPPELVVSAVLVNVIKLSWMSQWPRYGPCKAGAERDKLHTIFYNCCGKLYTKVFVRPVPPLETNTSGLTA